MGESPAISGRSIQATLAAPGHARVEGSAGVGSSYVEPQRGRARPRSTKS